MLKMNLTAKVFRLGWSKLESHRWAVAALGVLLMEFISTISGLLE